MRRGLRTFQGQKKAKVSENHSEILREGADDLTLRAQEVDTLEACISADPVEENFVRTAYGGRRLARLLPRPN